MPENELTAPLFPGQVAQMEPRDSGHPWLNKAIVWYVDFGSDSNQDHHISYRMAKEFNVQDSNKLTELLSYIKNGPGDWEAPGLSGTPRTPLSIESKKDRLMIFLLSDKNWRFPPVHTPFMVQQGYQQYYRKLRAFIPG